MRNAECELNAECRVQNAELRARIKCKMQSAKCKIKSETLIPPYP